MEKQYKQISELHNWEQNPRDIDENSFNRLKDQLTLKGQFEPLLTMQDGTVLGGNMRLRAMRELGFEQVWVSEIYFGSGEDGLWFAVLDGQERPEKFKTKEDAMMSWSLAHNADYGHYDLDQFANIEGNYDPMLWDQFAVNFQEPEVIQKTLDSIAPGANQEKQIAYQIIIPASDQVEAERIFNEMNEKGYNAKIKAQAKRK